MSQHKRKVSAPILGTTDLDQDKKRFRSHLSLTHFDTLLRTSPGKNFSPNMGEDILYVVVSCEMKQGESRDALTALASLAVDIHGLYHLNYSQGLGLLDPYLSHLPVPAKQTDYGILKFAKQVYYQRTTRKNPFIDLNKWITDLIVLAEGSRVVLVGYKNTYFEMNALYPILKTKENVDFLDLFQMLVGEDHDGLKVETGTRKGGIQVLPTLGAVCRETHSYGLARVQKGSDAFANQRKYKPGFSDATRLRCELTILILYVLWTDRQKDTKRLMHDFNVYTWKIRSLPRISTTQMHAFLQVKGLSTSAAFG